LPHQHCSVVWPSKSGGEEVCGHVHKSNEDAVKCLDRLKSNWERIKKELETKPEKRRVFVKKDFTHINEAKVESMAKLEVPV
jgi:hypothetical protein